MKAGYSWYGKLYAKSITANHNFVQVFAIKLSQYEDGKCNVHGSAQYVDNFRQQFNFSGFLSRCQINNEQC